MRARQIWDECKHSKLHADVLLGKGWIKDERELMHFMEGKFQIDFLCATTETQKPVEDALNYLLHQVGGIQ